MFSHDNWEVFGSECHSAQRHVQKDRIDICILATLGRKKSICLIKGSELVATQPCNVHLECIGIVVFDERTELGSQP